MLLVTLQLASWRRISYAVQSLTAAQRTPLHRQVGGSEQVMLHRNLCLSMYNSHKA
jgi:hypothetical protein